MKSIRVLISISLFFLFSPLLLFAQVAISTDGLPPHKSAMLDIRSDTTGLLVPRMNSTNRTGIPNPANGLIVYDTDYNKLYIKTNTGWMELIDYSGTAWLQNGDSIYSISRPVGIGINNPKFRLDVKETSGINPAAARFSGLNGPTNAYMAIQGKVDFDGEPNLDLAGMEIGLMGLSTGGSTTDNVGVFGYSNGAAGYFEHKTTGNKATLSNFTHAAHFEGKVKIDSSLYVKNLIEADSSLYVTNRVGIGTNSPSTVLHVKGEQNTDPVIRAEVMYTPGVTINAIEGIAMNYIGRGKGIFGEGGYVGVEGHGNGQSNANISYGGSFTGSGTAGSRYGIYALGNGTGTNNYGVSGAATSGSVANHGGFFQAFGTSGTLYGVYSRATGATTQTNYGIYAKAENASTNWAGYFDQGNVFVSNSLMVGISASTSKTHIKGNSSSTTPVLKTESSYSGYSNVRAIEAISNPAPGYGTGVYGSGGNCGVHGLGYSDTYTNSVYGGYFGGGGNAGSRYGVFAQSYGTGAYNVGVYGYASGAATTNYGIYANATNASGENWAGYFNQGNVKVNYKLQIGGTGAPSESVHLKSGGVRIDNTASSPQPKTLYGNSMPIAYGYISGAGIISDYGIASYTNPAVGQYTIVLDNNFTGAPVVIVTCTSTTPVAKIATYFYTAPNQIKVYTSTGSGTATPAAFSFMVFGSPQ